MGILPLGIVSPCASSVWLLVCCVSGYYPSGCRALHIMSLVNVSLWVFCLQGCHALGYHASGYCASLSVVHPCASSVWVSWLLGCFVSGCHTLGTAPPGVSHLPGYCASWYQVSSGITLMVIETWVPLGSVLLGKMPLGTAPLGAVPPGTTPLAALSLGIMTVMVPGRAHSHT